MAGLVTNTTNVNLTPSLFILTHLKSVFDPYIYKVLYIRKSNVVQYTQEFPTVSFTWSTRKRKQDFQAYPLAGNDFAYNVTVYSFGLINLIKLFIC